MCRRLRRREKLLRKPLEDAGGAGADLIFVKSFTPFTFYTLHRCIFQKMLILKAMRRSGSGES